MTLRGVLFDLDDTLTDSTGVDERVWLDVAEVIARHVPHVDRDLLRERYVGVTESHYVELASGRIDLATFRRRRLADALSPWDTVSDELFERYILAKERIVEETVPFAESIPVLRDLRARGLRVGVLTNGPSEFQRRKLEVSALEPELDAIAISEEIGATKPDRAAFAAALALLGTRPDETAMVGDSLANDVEGALSAGLAAVVWMNPDREPPLGAVGARSLAIVPSILGLA